MIRPPPISTLFPSPTLFRSDSPADAAARRNGGVAEHISQWRAWRARAGRPRQGGRRHGHAAAVHPGGCGGQLDSRLCAPPVLCRDRLTIAGRHLFWVASTAVRVTSPPFATSVIYLPVMSRFIARVIRLSTSGSDAWIFSQV